LRGAKGKGENLLQYSGTTSRGHKPTGEKGGIESINKKTLLEGRKHGSREEQRREIDGSQPPMPRSRYLADTWI